MLLDECARKGNGYPIEQPERLTTPAVLKLVTGTKPIYPSAILLHSKRQPYDNSTPIFFIYRLKLPDSCSIGQASGKFPVSRCIFEYFRISDAPIRYHLYRQHNYSIQIRLVSQDEGTW